MEDVNILDLYRVYKQYEEHENELLHQRTSWFITVQSVMVATFGFSLQKYYEVSEKIAELHQTLSVNASLNATTLHYKGFLTVLTIIGFFAAVSAIVSIQAAISAQNVVRARWEKEFRTRAESAGFPHIAGGGNKLAEVFGSFSAFILPLTFALLWVGVAIFILLDIRLA